MLRVGIICNLDNDRCPQYFNYYYAVRNLYGRVKLVNILSDLNKLDILFVGDDHHWKHKEIFTQNGFVEKCNRRDIKVVVFTAEKIFDSFFPWNIDNYEYLLKFRNLYHYTMDVDDCIRLGTKVHRFLMSNYYKGMFQINVNNKIDRIVFKGSTRCNSYKERNEVLQRAKEILPIDVLSQDSGNWKDYINTISKYRFLFSPIGNNNGLVSRFYEGLYAKCIVIQQVRKNTLHYYTTEAKLDDCIFFEDVEELPEKIKNYTLPYAHTEMWFEDYLKGLLKAAYLL